MTEYKNGFFRGSGESGKTYLKPVLFCSSEPIEYNGFLIYERIKDQVFDIVKDGICVGMNAGVNGAKDKIDNQKEVLSRRLQEAQDFFNEREGL